MLSQNGLFWNCSLNITNLTGGGTMLEDKEKVSLHIKRLQRRLANLQKKLAVDQKKMSSPKILKVEYDRLHQETHAIEESIEVLQEGILEWRKHYLGLVLLENGRGWCTECQSLVESPDFVWLEEIHVGWSRHHEGGSSTSYHLHHLCHDCHIRAKVLSGRLDRNGHGRTYYPCELVVINEGTVLWDSDYYHKRAATESEEGLLGYKCGGTGWLVKSSWALYRKGGWTDIFEQLWDEYCPSGEPPEEPMPFLPNDPASM